MVGFADFSDADDSAVDEIISQAQDAAVLEQLSAIRFASFSSDSLPSDLETRFRKLKSFPLTSKPNHTPKPPHHSSTEKSESNNPPSNEQTPPFSNADYSNSSKTKSKSKSKHGSDSPPSDSSNSSEESSISSIFKQEKYGKRSLKEKSRGGFQSSRVVDHSPSPPRKAGCFWCSPKKKDLKKKKSKKIMELEDILGLDKSDDEFLSDVSGFSSKQQEKLWKKAIKEEQKITREAEKIVQWAKQTSKRINSSNIIHDDDDLSD